MAKIQRSKTEERLYSPIMKILENKFKQLGSCYFEDTHDIRKEFSDKLKDELDYDSLFLLKAESMHPDLTGYVVEEEEKRIGIIVVEIKNRLTLKDIYQTKRYAEILNATYALLISPKKLSVERKRFLIKRKGEITSFLSSNQVLIGHYSDEKRSIQFDVELCENLQTSPKHHAALFEDHIELNQLFKLMVRPEGTGFKDTKFKA